jgi:signal transduction histidine kinase
MKLRVRLVLFFVLLAVVPLVAVGVFESVRSVRALHALLAAQDGAIAERVAAGIAELSALRESDLLLLTSNAETRRLYRAETAGSPRDRASARASADPYFRQAWEQFRRSYAWLEFRDRSGRSLYSLGEPPPVQENNGQAAAPSPAVMILSRPVPADSGTTPAGVLVAGARTSSLMPMDLLEAQFGRAGYSLIVDRETGRVIYHPRHAFLGRSVADLAGPSGWHIEPSALERSHTTFRYREGDSTRIGVAVALATPPWTVIVSSAVDEFAAPFVTTRLVNLSLVLLITLAASLAFVVLTGRATRSLEALTRAADDVGAGNFAPQLPPAGRDELGRLSAAFALMIEKVREMLRQIEASRHMVAVGRFAAQLSHEIRNPLTSLKLNLQGLQRDVAAGRIPEDARQPIAICLREIERLDRVLRGVLSLGRERPAEATRCSVHQSVTEALETMRAQLNAQRVTVCTELAAPFDGVEGDPHHLTAVFFNLLLNAAEAMPGGGTIDVVSANEPIGANPPARIRVRVADEGPGIAPDLRERVFEPFFSTKSEGTGFGLALALRTVEEHGGRLRLEPPLQGSGAVFVVELPIFPQGLA